MPNAGQPPSTDEAERLLRAHTERLRNIAAKRKRGQRLSQEDMEAIGWQPEGKAQSSYDSIAAAAAGLGVDKSVLRKAKREGAPGFRGSRVYPAELLPWLAGAANGKPNGDDAMDKDAWERRFLQVRVERQQFAFEVEKKNYILATDAVRWTAEMVAEFSKVLDAIPSTLAPDIVGVATIAEAERRIMAALEQAKLMLHKG